MLFFGLTGFSLLFSNNCLTSPNILKKIFSIQPRIINGEQFIGIGIDQDKDGTEDSKYIYKIIDLYKDGLRDVEFIGHYIDFNRDRVYTENEFVPANKKKINLKTF